MWQCWVWHCVWHCDNVVYIIVISLLDVIVFVEMLCVCVYQCISKNLASLFFRIFRTKMSFIEFWLTEYLKVLSYLLFSGGSRRGWLQASRWRWSVRSRSSVGLRTRNGSCKYCEVSLPVMVQADKYAKKSPENRHLVNWQTCTEFWARMHRERGQKGEHCW